MSTGTTTTSTSVGSCTSTNTPGNGSSSLPSSPSPGGVREPDPDAIKMFVGQIPRDWGESECRKLFEDFGEIYSLNVLRDKQTGSSRGCCFVTYYTRRNALEAQNGLHNIKTLPGMHHPIQMKPADSENRNERKLFIGMLSKKYSENDVRLMFAPFGHIEECTVLRDANGQSKGCAFVTFASRQCAVNAIKAMNHYQTMEGCSSPLVVKFADTQRDKDARRQQQLLMQQLAAASAITQPNPAATIVAAAAHPYIALAAAAAASAQQQQVQQQAAAQQQQQIAAATLALHQQFAASMNTGTDQLTLAAAAALASNPLMLASLCGAATTNGAPGGTQAQQTGHINGSNDLYGPTTPSQGQFSSLVGIAQLAAAANGAQQTNSGLLPGHQHHHSSTGSTVGKHMEGPEGANLFIYHLPAEFSDSDLAQAFSAFGNVLSSKVFIDKQTHLSKCFGFVSYDNSLSAQAAIQAMNGFQIGTKRLKVQLKRSKDKPY